MFYEKLAEAKQEKKKRLGAVPKALLAASAAELGFNAIAPTSNALSDYVSRKTRRADERDHLLRAIGRINPNIAQVVHEDNVHELTRNAGMYAGAKASAERDALKEFLAEGPGFAAGHAVDRRMGRHVHNPSFTRGAIAAPLDTSDTTSLMHELGHATGKLRRGKSPLYDKMYDKSLAFSRTPGRVLGLLRAGVESANVSKAKSEEDLDKIERRNRLLTAAHGLAASPHLFEEGRANIRAIGLGKKFGAKVNKAALAARMGTYLSGVGAQTLIPHYLTQYQINKRRKELRGQA